MRPRCNKKGNSSCAERHICLWNFISNQTNLTLIMNFTTSSPKTNKFFLSRLDSCLETTTKLNFRWQLNVNYFKNLRKILSKKLTIKHSLFEQNYSQTYCITPSPTTAQHPTQWVNNLGQVSNRLGKVKTHPSTIPSWLLCWLIGGQLNSQLCKL